MKNETPKSRQYKSSPLPFADHEFDLDAAINSKSHLMQFDPNAQEDNFSINLGKLGFKNPGDLKKFLLTPAGDTIKGEIATEIANKEAAEEQRRFELVEEEKRAHNLKAYLMLFLIEKKGHAKEQLRELIEIQNQKAIERSKSNSAPKESTSAKANQELKNTMRDYDNSIRDYQAQQEGLSAQEQELSNQIENLENQKAALADKHALYQKSIDEFEAEMEQYANMDDDAFNAKVAEMQAEIDALSDETTKLLDSKEPDSEEATQKLLDQQHAMNLKLNSLQDLRGKTFFDKMGEEVQSPKEAKYAILKDKKIVKDGEKFYLLKADQDPKALSQQDKEEAAKLFQNTKHELLTVKKSVQKTCKREREFHNFEGRIELAHRQRESTQADKMALENQIKLLQSARSNLNQPGTNPETPRPTPTTTHAAKSAVSAPQVVPVPVMSFARNFFLEFFSKTVSRDQFDKQIDKKAKDPKEAKEIKEFFKKALASLNLGQIPSLAPLPQTTMDSLLQHMARFGADPYKDGLTPLNSPRDSKGLAPQIPSPQKLPHDSTELAHSKASPEPEPYKSSIPSPFKMTPSGR